MDRRTSIPVRAMRPGEYHTRAHRTETGPPPGSPAEVDERNDRAESSQQEQVPTPIESEQKRAATETESSQDANDWRDQALRLQAEMGNFRKRQRRLAQEEIETERHRLLQAFLEVIDDLERALASPEGDDAALRQGLQLTHRAALRLMDREGAEEIEAEGQPFDPSWHEAVATIGRNGNNVAAGTVVQVIEPGYRLGSRLLRPSKVIVAV